MLGDELAQGLAADFLGEQDAEDGSKEKGAALQKGNHSGVSGEGDRR